MNSFLGGDKGLRTVKGTTEKAYRCVINTRDPE